MIHGVPERGRSTAAGSLEYQDATRARAVEGAAAVDRAGGVVADADGAEAAARRRAGDLPVGVLPPAVEGAAAVDRAGGDVAFDSQIC